MSLGAGEVEQKQKRGIMKTITVTLFAAALGFAQNGGVVTTRPATINTGRPAPPKNQKPAQPTKPSPSKAAKTETGLVVQVPPFINEGEKIKVDTAEGVYLSRA